MKGYFSPIDGAVGINKIIVGKHGSGGISSAYHICDSVSNIKKQKQKQKPKKKPHTVNEIKKIKGELNASSESSFLSSLGKKKKKSETYFWWFLQVPITVFPFQLLDKSPHITLNGCLLALIVI